MTSEDTEHKHSFCVDTECECGVKLSSYTQQLYSKYADLRRQVDNLKIDLQMANEENADLRHQLGEIETLALERPLRIDVGELKALLAWMMMCCDPWPDGVDREIIEGMLNRLSGLLGYDSWIGAHDTVL